VILIHARDPEGIFINHGMYVRVNSPNPIIRSFSAEDIEYA